MKRITIEHEVKIQDVPVTIKYISHAGNRVVRHAGNKKFYEALGIRI